MASSDDRNNNNSGPSSCSENPFIRFRQFADSHISSLLQGVLGLPSAFTNKPDSPRWADFDKELRRKGDSEAMQEKARQKIEDQRMAAEGHLSGDVKSSMSPLADTLPFYLSVGLREPLEYSYVPVYSSSNGSEGGPFELSDVPLYSSFNGKHWQTLSRYSRPEPSMPLPDRSTLTTFDWRRPMEPKAPWSDNPDMFYHEAMQVTNAFVLKMLNQSSGPHHLPSNKPSLLPYLLLSPYSPLKLSTMAQTDVNMGIKSPDLFPYTEAFADLLSTTQLDQPYPNRAGRYMPRPGVGAMEMGCRNLNSIGKLDRHNLLYSSEMVSDAQSPDNFKQPTTEQEMYESFLNVASLPAVAATTFNSLFKEIEKTIDEQLDPKLRAAKDAWKREHAKEKDESRTASEQLDEVWKNIGEIFKEETESTKSAVKLEVKAEIDGSKDGDRVVSTSTTTRRTRHEDGSVETSVTVERTFADGRETVTTTTHEELPKWQDEDIEQIQKTQQASTEQKKVEKQGWFWN